MKTTTSLRKPILSQKHGLSKKKAAGKKESTTLLLEFAAKFYQEHGKVMSRLAYE